MENKEFTERLVKVEERAKSNTHQINELKPVINEIYTMSKTLVALVQQTESTDKNVRSLNEKVDALEKEPVARLTQIKTAIITALISAVISGLIGAVIYFN